MIKKQLYAKWLVPCAIDKWRVENFPITCGSTQKENSYFWLWFPEHHTWCSSTFHKWVSFDCFPFKVLWRYFNWAYYLAKKERLYCDFQDLLCSRKKKNRMKKSTCYRSNRAAAKFVNFVGKAMKEDFVKDILNSWYYSVLTDWSTDASTLEQEVLYGLFLSSGRVPVLKFLSINTLNTHTLIVWNNASKILFNALELPPGFKIVKNECWWCSCKYWRSQWVWS